VASCYFASELWNQIESKICPKISLDNLPNFIYFSVIFSHPLNNLILYFWGIYEMGFPEGSNIKAPGDLGLPLGAFLICLSRIVLYEEAWEILNFSEEAPLLSLLLRGKVGGKDSTDRKPDEIMNIFILKA
jgi:hypothetical protein